MLKYDKFFIFKLAISIVISSYEIGLSQIVDKT